MNVAVSSADTGYHTDSASAEMDYPTLRGQVDTMTPVYEQAYRDGVIDKPRLDELQTLLQNLTGMYASDLGGELASFRLMNARTLYLRHWSNICTHFVQAHRASLVAAYSDAGIPLPALGSMSRADVLAHIRRFPARASASQAAKKLLEDVLRDLTPSMIPDNWN